MKVTGWTDWENDKYETMPSFYIEGKNITAEQFEEAWNAVVEEIKNKGYKFSGTYHQNGDFGCPVIDDEYVFCVSMRNWGQVMVEAHNIPDEDGFAYCRWAWTTPDGEEMIVPGDNK